MEELYERLKKHRIRFYPGQKQRFRDAMTSEFNELGYDDVTVDKAKNMIIGDVHNAKVVYTAHYDTPMFSPWFLFARVFGHLIGGVVFGSFVMLAAIAVVAAGIGIVLEGLVTGEFLTFAEPLYFMVSLFVLFILSFVIPSPGNANDNTSGVLAVYEVARRLKERGMEKDAAFILFNNEELGLLGSSAFKSELMNAAKSKHGKGASKAIWTWLAAVIVGFAIALPIEVMGYENFTFVGALVGIVGTLLVIASVGAKMEFKSGRYPKFALINFDCVGVGDRVMLGYASANGKKICERFVDKFPYPVDVKRGNILTAGSDHLNFKNNGIGVFVTKRSYFGPLYLPRVHNPFNMKADLGVIKNICESVLDVEF